GHVTGVQTCALPIYDRNQSCFGPNRFGELIKIDNSVVGSIEPGHFEIFMFLQMLDLVEDGMMLGLVRDDVTTAVHLASRESEHRQIASFCPAAGENDFVRLGVKQRGDFIARVIDRGARVSSSSVNTGWITEMLTEVRQHRFSGSFAKRGSRVVIQINHFGLNRNPLDRMSQKVLE